ncbi:MAG: PQQ-binding-like beta-propeller repeat protein [Pirellulaceae bacterium]|nr:PQQ-binding-like beta-propeller repeat protein [Pirellulaceae bacterium]
MSRLSISGLCFSCLMTSLAWGLEPTGNWPRFRGPAGTGQFVATDLPTKWSAGDIAWQVDLPVVGHSSPIVWGDKIFLTGASAKGDVVSRHVICLDRRDGKLLWDQVAARGSGEDLHKMNSWATPSCVTDGQCVVAFFGDGGLHCFESDGTPRWSRQLGQFPGNWGVGASPILVGSMVVQNCDAAGESYLLAVDQQTGKDIWRTARREKPRGGWSTPILIDFDGAQQLVLNGEFGVESYDPQTGKTIWVCKGFNGRGTPVPTWGNGLIYAVNGKAGDVYAVKPSGQGDVTQSHMAWHTPRGGGRDLPSPVLTRESLVVVGMAGIATGYDPIDGKELWKKRLGGNFSGSPIVAGDLVYIAADNGVVTVLKAGKSIEVVAQNDIGVSSNEIVRSSLAVHNGQLLLRSDKKLYCIGN